VTPLRFMTSMERRTRVLAGHVGGCGQRERGSGVAGRGGVKGLTDAAFAPVLVYAEHGDVASV
jgi:hypothetical protein